MHTRCRSRDPWGGHDAHRHGDGPHVVMDGPFTSTDPVGRRSGPDAGPRLPTPATGDDALDAARVLFVETGRD